MGRVVESFDWSARQEDTARGASVLRVRGRCRLLEPGCSVELRRLSPQGINPRVCILHLLVHRPLWWSRAPQATVVEVEHSEIAATTFDSVLIMPDGVSVKVLGD